MKALITAGGRGTRLRPITHTSNKHLIPIANKPMISYALEAVRDVGITEVGIIVNETRPEVESFLGSGSGYDLDITYIEQREPLGLAHCVKISRDFLGDESFLFYLGDNILAGGIDRFVERFEEEEPDALLLLSEVQDPERFGVPEIFDGRIVGIEEKPEKPKSNFAVTGIYFYSPSVWEVIDKIKPSPRGELEISDVHDTLIDDGKTVLYDNVSGWWKDTGKPEDLILANHLVLQHIDPSIQGELVDTEYEGVIRVGKGCVIKNSILRGPLVIGNNVYINESYIGPYTSISDGVSIQFSGIENSIVLENANILDLPQRLDASLIGKEGRIKRDGGHPHSLKMVIGDNSDIVLV